MNLVVSVLVITVLFGFSEAQGEISGRIFKGEDVEDGKFKYMAFLSALESGCCGLFVRTTRCGGAIIAANWVLTAAHCVDGMIRIVVYLGVTIPEFAEISYEVTKDHFVIHPNWDDNLDDSNDIALVQIPATAECSKIAYAKLPLSSLNNKFTNKIAVTMGWGDTGYHRGSSQRLKKTNVAVMSQDDCKEYLPSVTELDICVRTYGPFGSICSGDSGGPLVFEPTGELIGIASFLKSTNCEDRKPAYFARVTSYLPWILKRIGSTSAVPL